MRVLSGKVTMRGHRTAIEVFKNQPFVAISLGPHGTCRSERRCPALQELAGLGDGKMVRRHGPMTKRSFDDDAVAKYCA